jgi:hypothetical protein
MSKSLSTAFPGGEPSKATHLRSGESRGRFAFWRFFNIRLPRELLGESAQMDGDGFSLQ